MRRDIFEKSHHYRKQKIARVATALNPGPIQLLKGFWVGLYTGGLISGVVGGGGGRGEGSGGLISGTKNASGMI